RTQDAGCELDGDHAITTLRFSLLLASRSSVQRVKCVTPSTVRRTSAIATWDAAHALTSTTIRSNKFIPPTASSPGWRPQTEPRRPQPPAPDRLPAPPTLPAFRRGPGAPCPESAP